MVSQGYHGVPLHQKSKHQFILQEENIDLRGFHLRNDYLPKDKDKKQVPEWKRIVDVEFGG